MSEGQDDAPEEARDEGRAQVATASAGVMAQEGVRSHRGQGRRVTLVRQRSGNYSIWMMSRHIQGFCNEWEDITNFQLPEGIEQQVRINIEVVGDAREIRSEYSGEEQDSRAEVAQEDPNPLIGGDLLNMFRELPQHNREIIERQIRANHQAEFGVALRSRAHPGSLLADVAPGPREETLQSLERQLERIGIAVERLRR